MEHNVLDSELIDVSELSLCDLLAEVEHSSLARALNKVLASDRDYANSFQSSI